MVKHNRHRSKAAKGVERTHTAMPAADLRLWGQTAALQQYGGLFRPTRCLTLPSAQRTLLVGGFANNPGRAVIKFLVSNFSATAIVVLNSRSSGHLD
jgi:hypothetical protein